MTESDFDYGKAISYARKYLASLGVTPEAGNIANAAAVGITQLVWRNGPIENAHAGARGRRNVCTTASCSPGTPGSTTRHLKL